MPNALYYGDNLPVLRGHLAEESVDLVYLDPPFNSNQDYNVLFKEQSGEPAQAQMRAFTDTWEWSEKAYVEFCEQCPNQTLADLVQGFVKTLGRNDVTAYLVMMAPRLVELHRVLKATGSLYLHCDPTASHYLKLMLDAVFGPVNFCNEISWKRSFSHGSSKRYGPLHDVILFYAKSDSYIWTDLRRPHEDDYIKKHFTQLDEKGRHFAPITLTGSGVRHGQSGTPWRGIDPTKVGRHWALPGEIIEELGIEGETLQDKLDSLDNAGMIFWPEKEGGTPRLKWYADKLRGVALQDIWTDIPPISAQAAERMGYPTQKPLALLERIIEASSNEGDVVLDPFCGCGTAVVAAQKLKRKWIGIDITHLAIALIKYRLSDSFRPRLIDGKDYSVIGEPTRTSEAEALAVQDRDEFQKWAVGLVPRAFPYHDKKGADSGIDGFLRFRDDNSAPKKNVIQIKSGKLTLSAVRDFAHVIDREKATLGLFISLEEPTKPMQQEADKMGFYTTPLGNRKISRFQIRTVEQLLNEQPFDIPQTAELTGVKTAAEIKEDKQIGLL